MWNLDNKTKEQTAQNKLSHRYKQVVVSGGGGWAIREIGEGDQESAVAK